MKEKNKNNIKELLLEYEYKIESYKDFAFTIKSLLEKVLKNNGFNKQSVTCRAKDRNSLSKKIKKTEYLGKLSKISDINDIAGCRIIFYLEKDIERVIPLLRSDFKIIDYKLLYSTNKYNGIHLIVSLKKDRLKLNEYKNFADLKCEIQLTTVLHHAWSELEHDVIYKPEKELLEFDPKTFESLKKRFSEIMENQIKEAQHGFDFIFEEVEKLRQGKETFDVSFINTIINAKSINSLYENLKLFLKYIDEYGDKTPKNINIIDIVMQALSKSRSLQEEKIKTPLGDFPGHNHSEVVMIVLDLLSKLRYLHLPAVFDLLVNLEKETGSSNKKKIYETIGKIVEYTYWPKDKKIYFIPQLQILDMLEKWNDKKLLENKSIIVELGKHILKSSYEGQTWKSNAVIFHHGSLPVNLTVKKIRQRMLNILFKTYILENDLKGKIELLQTLYVASETPHSSAYGEDMENMVLGNVRTIIEFYLSIVSSSDFEIIKKIEEQCNWFKRRFTKVIPEKLSELYNLIISNEEYGRYRLFVGYDHDYFENFDFKKAEEFRAQKIREIINEISIKNYDMWLSRILMTIKNYHNIEDRGQFMYLNRFLNECTKEKPEIGLKLIEVKQLEPFLIHIITGIWQSPEKAKAKKIINSWIIKGENLSTSAYIFTYVNEIDDSLIEKIFEKSKESKDVNALNNIIKSLGQNSDSLNKKLTDLLIKTIKELTELKNNWWVYNVWFQVQKLLANLNENQWNIILDNLLLLPNISYETEEILLILANKYPKKFIGFFEKRVDSKKNTNYIDHYDAIPFNFTPRQAGNLNDLSEKHKKIFIDEIFKWFKKDDWLSYWEGSHLLENIFPAFDPYLESKSISLLKSKKKYKANIVLNILRAYKGESFLHNICKEFIKKYPTNKDYQNEMFIILSQTGLVSGEYGFVNLYQSRIKDIQSWKTDKSKVIQKFIKNYEEYLNKRVSFEQKRADEDIDHRKREYGEK